MKAKIKQEHKVKFNPTFRTVVMGRPIDVSLKQAENEAEKFALTPMGHLYEGIEDLKKSVLSRQSKPETQVLNMNNAKRGTSFNPEGNPKKLAIAKFKEDQKKQRSKIERRYEANKPKAKATKKK